MDDMIEIYLDHAATTPCKSQVVEAMIPYFSNRFGNPSASYMGADSARQALHEARVILAETIGASPEEIIATSGGTEGDNWAISGVVPRVGRGHIITSQIEHPAVLESCKWMERQGMAVTYLPVSEDGIVDLEQLERSFRADTMLVSVMYANNETGAIQPIREIARIAKQHGVPFHTDGVQAYGNIPISVEDGFTMLSVSAHKFGGPKGVGFLYCEKGKALSPFLHGGGQESGRRAGTENVPGIVGMAKAAKLKMESRAEWDKIRSLREFLWQGLQEKIPGCVRNSQKELCLPGHLHVSFPMVEAQRLLTYLDMHQIYASGGSACAGASGKPSHVLKAMGKPEEYIMGAIRFTLGEENTAEQMNYVVSVVEKFYRDHIRT